MEINPQNEVTQFSPSYTLNPTFESAFNDVMHSAHKMAVSKGFWNDDTPETAKLVDDNRLLRIHGEVSELGEALRDGNPPCPKKGMEGFSSAEEEAADIVIRTMDMCARRGWRLAEAITTKMAVNAKRPYLHGRANA